MPYDPYHRGRSYRGNRRGDHPARGRRRGEGAPHPQRRPSAHPRRPWDLPYAGGYTGPGEAGRYGDAPVPFGPEHTYDYHLGDRYGYGPDFQIGEERIGHRPPPPRPRWRRRRR